MEKLLVEVTSPTANLTYDMFIPCNIQIGVAAKLISSIFAQLSGGTYVSTGVNIICEKETGMAYNPNLFVRDTMIRNGTKLLLY